MAKVEKVDDGWRVEILGRLEHATTAEDLEQLLDRLEAIEEREPSPEFWRSKLETVERAIEAGGCEMMRCAECGARIVAEAGGRRFCLECKRRQRGGPCGPGASFDRLVNMTDMELSS